MTQKEMVVKAMDRPTDFHSRSAEEQWAIDKSLGILDFDGFTDPKEEEKYWETHPRHT